jgi:hypothetical protein
MEISEAVWAAVVRVTLLFRPITLEEHKDVGLILSANYVEERRQHQVSHPNLTGALAEKREQKGDATTCGDGSEKI